MIYQYKPHNAISGKT